MQKKSQSGKMITMAHQMFLAAFGRFFCSAVGGALFEHLDLESEDFEITRPVLELARLPVAWDGSTIALLTDMHIGRWIDMHLVNRWVCAVESARPDIICLAGDFGSLRHTDVHEFSEAMARLADCADTFAVWGNHDFYHHRKKKIRTALEDANIPILVNSHATLFRNSAALCILGLDDIIKGQPNVQQAVRGVDAAVPRLLLCHNPDFAEAIPHDVRVDAMLCGHTHGGQINFPLVTNFFSPIRFKEYLHGLVAGPSCPVYISRGLGVVGIPMRYKCKPELPIITLKSK